MIKNSVKLAVVTLGLLSVNCYADDSEVVSLFDGEKENIVQEDKNDEGKGLFSFLNFKVPFSDEKIKKQTSSGDIIKQADNGNLESQLLLGYFYLYGENGFTVDYEKAFEYYGKAALQNDPTGLNNLGSLYYSGIGVKRNSAKAVILFQKAAELGNADAAVNLGFILMTGNGAVQDKEKAMQYFERAAELENSIAQFMLGYAYYTGKYRPQNYIMAAPLIKKAADAGIDEAQLILADIYIKGFGFPQNYNNAVKYLRLSASQGNTEAMMTLADILVEGEKYKKDIEFAHVLYNLAAVRGVADAPKKRQEVESKMKINDILNAQFQAESFVEKPTPLTTYIHQTFGNNLRAMF